MYLGLEPLVSHLNLLNLLIHSVLNFPLHNTARSSFTLTCRFPNFGLYRGVDVQVPVFGVER